MKKIITKSSKALRTNTITAMKKKPSQSENFHLSLEFTFPTNTATLRVYHRSA
jgi:hypothetical protein